MEETEALKYKAELDEIRNDLDTVMEEIENSKQGKLTEKKYSKIPVIIMICLQLILFIVLRFIFKSNMNTEKGFIYIILSFTVFNSLCQASLDFYKGPEKPRLSAVTRFVSIAIAVAACAVH